MTDHFLTVEDCNTVIYDNQEFWWHEIDISKITDGTEDFTNIPYDFCKITRTYDDTEPQMKYIFIIKIDHLSWTGGVHINKSPNSLETYSGGCKIKCSHSNIKLRLYMGSLWFGVSPLLFSLLSEKASFNLKQLKSQQHIEYTYADGSAYFDQYVLLSKGYNLIKHSGLRVGYFYVNLLKTDFQFNCIQDLVVGRVNKVSLGASADYKPNGDYVGSYTPTIRVEYGDKEIPVSFDEDLNDYVFNLDLSDVNTPSRIRFKVNVETNDVLNESSTSVSLDADYEIISTYSSLVSACGNGGATNIRLGNDITLTNSIQVKHYIRIIGDDHTLNLNGQGFILNKDITFKAENVVFDSGEVAIKQGKNTTVELNGCTFNNNTGFGSCISCDIDYDSLSIADDYHTTLNDCLFTNNDTCIVHGGQITITGCKYHNTDTTYINSENVAFLYQMDGSATIENNIFDIDYDTDTLCSNQQNIGFAQALIQCGTTAYVNGASSTQLLEDNKLPFDRNASHIFAKYYYPQIETCVYTSPVLSKEDKAVCYTVTGENWIYKQNVQITRASWDTQNETRKIIWEE